MTQRETPPAKTPGKILLALSLEVVLLALVLSFVPHLLPPTTRLDLHASDLFDPGSDFAPSRCRDFDPMVTSLAADGADDKKLLSSRSAPFSYPVRATENQPPQGG